MSLGGGCSGGGGRNRNGCLIPPLPPNPRSPEKFIKTKIFIILINNRVSEC